MKRLGVLGLFIVLWFTCLAQSTSNPKDDFTANKVNEYLNKYGFKVANLTDQIVLDGTLKNAGVFYGYSTLNSFIKLYSLSHEGLSPIDYFNESLKAYADITSGSAAYFGIPILGQIATGVKITNSIIQSIADDLDKKFLFNQLVYYQKMIEYNVSVDPYLEGYTNDGGYLLSPTGQSFAPLDRYKLTGEYVKQWVLSNYEIIKNYKEIERESQINAQNLHDFLVYRCDEINRYKSGILTNAVVNTDNSVIVNNNGGDTLFNFVLNDQFIGISLKKSVPVTILPYTRYTVQLGDLFGNDINSMEFQVLGETVKLDFNNQKLPYITLMNIFHKPTTEQKGFAPEQLTIHFLILPSGNNHNYTSTLSYGDGSPAEIINLNNGINSFVDFDWDHQYTQPGKYTVVISTVDELGNRNEISQSCELQNPLGGGLPLNLDTISFPKTSISFSADSVKCVFNNSSINYLWDFDYNGQSFHVDKIGKQVSWNYDTDPNLFNSQNYVEHTIGLIASLTKNGVTINDTVFQTIKLFNPVVARFNPVASSKDIIIDVDSLPYMLNLDASKSFSYKGDPLQYYWSIDQTSIGEGKIINYSLQTNGLHSIKLLVTDGNYNKTKSDKVTLSFNVSYDPQCKVNQLECFFDQDPGYGNGIQVPTVVPNSVIKVNTTINCSNLSTGLHRLYFRAKDNLGKWGIPQSQIVIVQHVNNLNSLSKIDYAEYFFDNDPGLGLATKFNITLSDSLLINETLFIENLSLGIHTISVRVRDELGRWSIPVVAQFEVEKGIATDVNSFFTNPENNYKIYGGQERLTIITPNNDLIRKYQLKVYTLNGTLILDKHVVGSQKININKGFYVVDIIDDLQGNKTTQKILTY